VYINSLQLCTQLLLLTKSHMFASYNAMRLNLIQVYDTFHLYFSCPSYILQSQSQNSQLNLKKHDKDTTNNFISSLQVHQNPLDNIEMWLLWCKLKLCSHAYNKNNVCSISPIFFFKKILTILCFTDEDKYYI